MTCLLTSMPEPMFGEYANFNLKDAVLTMAQACANVNQNHYNCEIVEDDIDSQYSGRFYGYDNERYFPDNYDDQDYDYQDYGDQDTVSTIPSNGRQGSNYVEWDLDCPECVWISEQSIYIPMCRILDSMDEFVDDITNLWNEFAGNVYESGHEDGSNLCDRYEIDHLRLCIEQHHRLRLLYAQLCINITELYGTVSSPHGKAVLAYFITNAENTLNSRPS